MRLGEEVVDFDPFGMLASIIGGCFATVANVCRAALTGQNSYVSGTGGNDRFYLHLPTAPGAVTEAYRKAAKGKAAGRGVFGPIPNGLRRISSTLSL